MDIKSSLPSAAHVRKNILAGLLAVTPLLVTWVVFEFIFTQVIRFGKPGTSALYWAVYRFSPDLAEWLFSWWVESAIAINGGQRKQSVDLIPMEPVIRPARRAAPR